MRARRGVALLAALWIVVAIAAVALQFAKEAHERRTIGLLASERGQQRALAMGAFALVQAQLEQALRVTPSGTNVQRLRSSDPWLDIDSIYSVPVMVDSIQVDVVAHDLGEKLNVNSANEMELRNFFSYLLKDVSTATSLSQAILDWRDADSIPRVNGAERDDYLKEEMLALPTNGLFREVDDLRNVMGMTPEIFAQASPYLTTRGQGQVNLNTAPEAVLRSMTGMTEPILATILAMRANGQRIESLAALGARVTGGRGGQANANSAFAGRATVTTTNVELTIVARLGPQSQPTRLRAILTRSGTNTQISQLLW